MGKEEEMKFEDVEIDESEAYAAFFSNDRVVSGENNGQDDKGGAKEEWGEEVTIIETNGPATGVDVVLTEEATEEATGVDVLLTQPDPEEARQSMEESVSGETNEENLVISEQASLDETDEDLSHLAVGTNKELLMVEEVAKEEEEDVGSDKQESEEEEEEMEHDPPASPPVSDSSSISIPPSPIPKEVLGSRGSSIRSSPSPSHSPLNPTTGLNLSMTAKEMRNMLASRRKKDPRIDDRTDFRRKHEIIQTLWEPYQL